MPLAEWKAWVGNSLIRPYLKQNPVSVTGDSLPAYFVQFCALVQAWLTARGIVPCQAVQWDEHGGGERCKPGGPSTAALCAVDGNS